MSDKKKLFEQEKMVEIDIVKTRKEKKEITNFI